MAHEPAGLDDADTALIRATVPLLNFVLKSGTNRETAENLLGIYLGQGAC